MLGCHDTLCVIIQTRKHSRQPSPVRPVKASQKPAITLTSADNHIQQPSINNDALTSEEHAHHTKAKPDAAGHHDLHVDTPESGAVQHENRPGEHEAAEREAAEHEAAEHDLVADAPESDAVQHEARPAEHEAAEHGLVADAPEPGAVEHENRPSEQDAAEHSSPPAEDHDLIADAVELTTGGHINSDKHGGDIRDQHRPLNTQMQTEPVFHHQMHITQQLSSTSPPAACSRPSDQKLLQIYASRIQHYQKTLELKEQQLSELRVDLDKGLQREALLNLRVAQVQDEKEKCIAQLQQDKDKRLEQLHRENQKLWHDNVNAVKHALFLEHTYNQSKQRNETGQKRLRDDSCGPSHYRDRRQRS